VRIEALSEIRKNIAQAASSTVERNAMANIETGHGEQT
jgi:hypothetical protein